MTREQILALSGRYLDEAVARYVTGRLWSPGLPYYSRSRAACLEAEDVVLQSFERGAYLRALRYVASGVDSKETSDLECGIATATAEQRCRAMLIAKLGAQ